MALLSMIDGVVGGLDRLYFQLHWGRYRAVPPLFNLGWGSHHALAAVNERWQSMTPPSEIEMAWEGECGQSGGIRVRRGCFATPAHREYLPPESLQCYVHFIEPTQSPNGPVVVMAPSSREAGVKARIPIARYLARRGVSSLLLESPFMGRRKPASQFRTTLSHFSDFVLLAGVSIEEIRAALRWLVRAGRGPLCVAGISKGAYLATVAGLRSPERPHVVALLPPRSGVPVLLDGLVSRLCDWDLLQRSSGSIRPVREQMTELFEETSLERLAPAVAPQKLILIGARRDRYVPRQSYERLASHWQGRATVRWLPGGHVSSIAERRHLLRAIHEVLGS